MSTSLTTIGGMAAPHLLVVETAEADPIGRLGKWLGEAGLDLDVRRPFRAVAELPEDLDGAAGLVVLGGGPPVNAHPAWLPAVRAVLRDAISAELPTLAVGQGAQLLATAHGARTGSNPEGPEYGPQLIAKRAAAATDPLFGPMPITPDVIQWHVQALRTLPPGALHLASAPVCDLQAFRLGRLAWGLQFHIETGPERVREWARADTDALDGYDIEEMLRRSDAVHTDIAEVWRPFAMTFAGIVGDPASVAPAHPPRVATAAPVTDPVAIRAALAQEAHAARTVLPDPTHRGPEKS